MCIILSMMKDNIIHDERHPFRANGSEFADSAFSNIAATFCQCLSPIVSKLSTRDKSRKLGKASW